MAVAATSLGRECLRCGYKTTPRGGMAPRYCAVCGQPLGIVQGAADLRLQYAQRRPPALFAEAILAVFAGLLSILPLCGAIFSIVAIAMGVSMLNKAGHAPEMRFWRRVGAIAICLGVLGGFLNLVALGVF